MAKSVTILFMVIILLLCIYNINGLEEKENSNLSRRKLLEDDGNDPSGQPPTVTTTPQPTKRRPTRKPTRRPR